MSGTHGTQPNREVGEIRVGRFTVPYRVYGKRGDREPPIVCVNGAQQSMAAWRSFVSHFQSGYRVVLFDFPGQGRAQTHSGPPAVSLEEHVEVLARVVRQTASDSPIHIMSASWGGIVASAFAAREHGRIERLLLASFSVRANVALRDLIDRGMTAIKQRDRALCGRLLIDSIAGHVSDELKHQIRRQFLTMPERQLDTFYKHMSWCRDIDIEGMVDFRKIRAKTLIAIGELDYMIDKNDVYRVAGQIPDCMVYQIPGAGHFLHFEQSYLLSRYKQYFNSISPHGIFAASN